MAQTNIRMEDPMTQGNQRHILLCVAGMTPQVITETLYVLT